MAFWKMVSLSPVSIMRSTSASLARSPVTVYTRRSTTSLPPGQARLQGDPELCMQLCSPALRPAVPHKLPRHVPPQAVAATMCIDQHWSRLQREAMPLAEQAAVGLEAALIYTPAAHRYSSFRRWRRTWKSPMMSLSFFFSAAVTAVRVRSLLEPGPQPCAPALALVLLVRSLAGEGRT